LNKQNPTFRKDLQGLRAIAILLVIIAHSKLGFMSGGFIGVDVFFVLSGFLITNLLYREIQETSRLALIPFYAKRIKRLFPALIIMIIGSCCLAFIFLSETEAKTQLASLPFATSWTSNLYFNFVTFDYFNELATRDLFLHTWSLGVEEQFYLIWPVILITLFWLGKKQLKPTKVIFLGLLLTFIISLSLSLYFTFNYPHAAFYQMPSRIWQFSLGALICFAFLPNALTRNNAIEKLLFNKIVLLIGLALIFISSITMHPALTYPGFWALIPSLGTVLVIMAGQSKTIYSNRPLTQPILIWLGDRSYSLYLWHWPIFIISFSLGYQGQLMASLIMILISLLTADLSYRFIELPFWKGRWSKAKPRQIILISLFIMVSVIVVSYHAFLRQPLQPTVTTDMNQQWRSDQPIIYRLPCDAWYEHSRVEPCVFNADGATKTVVLFGDSITAQWFSMLPAIFQKPLWQIIVLTKSSCPIIDEEIYYPRIRRIYKVCSDWRNGALDTLKEIKPDVVIMGNTATADYNKTQWLEGSSRILEKLTKIGSTVFIIPGTPSLGFDGPACVSRNISPEGQIDAKSCLAKNRMKNITSVVGILEQATNRFTNAHVLNLNDLVCPEGICKSIDKQGVVIFRDSQHLTDTFVRKQVPVIRKRIKAFYKDLVN